MSRQASPKPRVILPLLNRYHLVLPFTDLPRLAGLLLVAIVLSLWIVNSSVTADSLFQSPASPIEQPQAQEQPPAQPPPAQEPPPVEQQPQPTPPQPASQPQQPQPTLQQPAAPEQPANGSQTTEDTSAPSPAPQEPAPESLSPAEPVSTPGRSSRNRAVEEPSASTDESHNFILDQVEFIDSVVVSGAYIWLCCGVMLFLLVPIFMLVLYIRGRSKLGPEDNF